MNRDDESRLRERLEELAVALGVVILGGVVIWQTTQIRLTPVNSRVGPRVIPYLVGAGLVVTGLWFAIDVIRGRLAQPTAGDDAEDVDLSLDTDWATVAMIAASLLVYLLLLERAGFIIASALLFVGAAFGMGSRHLIRDPVVGLVLSVVTYFVFTEGLSLRLPEGVLHLNGLF